VRGSGLLDALLALYPPWWRARYGDEVRAISSDVIAGGRSPWRVSGNLLVGAVRTRVGGGATPRQFVHWAGRARASIVVATLPVLAVIPVIFSFLQERQDLPPGQTTPFAFYGVSEAGHVADDAIVVMALAMVLAVSTILWGYVDLSGAVRKRGDNDRRLRRLVRVPGRSILCALILWVAAIFARPNEWLGVQGASKPLDGHPALAHALTVASAAFLGMGLAAALVMAVVVARRGTLSLPDLSSGRWVGVTTSVLLWVMATAAVTSVIALGRQGDAAHRGYDVVITSWGSWWIAGVLILVLAAVVSTIGAANATRSLRVISQLHR
jgi:hypothetical protein